jgi:hypothetical protein
MSSPMSLKTASVCAHSTPKCIKKDEKVPGEGTITLYLKQKIKGIMCAKSPPIIDIREKMPDLRI